MSLGNRRVNTPCFCHFGCLPGTYLFYHYWVGAPALFNPNYGGDTFLYRFVGLDEEGACTWEAVENHLGPFGTEQLKKFVLLDGGEIVGWRWVLFLGDGTGINAWQEDYLLPDPIPTQVIPESVGSCSRMDYLLTPLNPLNPFQARLRPGYPDACLDEDFPMKMQTKVLAPF